MAVSSNKRPSPPLLVPAPTRGGGGIPSKRFRDLNVMLHDLGLLRGPVTSYYNQHTRNGVSLLQQRLIADGYYKGVPGGSFDAATREALLAHPDIPTTT